MADIEDSKTKEGVNSTSVKNNQCGPVRWLSGTRCSQSRLTARGEPPSTSPLPSAHVPWQGHLVHACTYAYIQTNEVFFEIGGATYLQIGEQSPKAHDDKACGMDPVC